MPQSEKPRQAAEVDRYADLEERLVDLEARYADLGTRFAGVTSRLAALEAQPVDEPAAPLARPVPLAERGVSITFPVEPAPDLPNEEEFHKLERIVLGRFTKIAPAPGREEEFSADFRRAFIAIARLDRTESGKANTKYDLGWWIDHVSQSAGGCIRGNAFIAAVIAAGDVSWTEYDASRGNVWEFGLMAYGGGRRATAGAWRKVLLGEVVKPTRPDRPFDLQTGMLSKISA